MLRRYLRNAMPSMFQRRLALLMGAVVLIGLALGMQAVRLTLGNSHNEALVEAEKRLVHSSYIPTIRGRIFDRTGRRLLAMDEPGYDVAVDFEVIDGTWAYEQARWAAYREHRDQWGELTSDEKDQLAQQYRQPFEEQVQLLWQTLAGITQTPRVDLDDRLNDIRRNVLEDASYLWLVWRRSRQRELNSEVSLSDVIQPIREEKTAHAVVRDIDEQARIAIEDFVAMAEHQEQMPKDERDPTLEVWQHVKIQKPKRRRHPMETMTVVVDTESMPSPVREKFNGQPVEVTVEGVGMNILGLMRDAWAEDMAENPFSHRDEEGGWQVDLHGYRDGDRVGSSGVEATLEDQLRGKRGKRTLHLDSKVEDRIEPEAGEDVQLTIDIALQARLQALLGDTFGLTTVQDWHPRQDPNKDRRNPPKLGDKLQAGAVVVDVDSGEVLAAASYPGVSHRQLESDPRAIFEDHLHRPFLDRAFGLALQPGSTMKPLVLLAANADHKYHTGEEIVCRGYLEEGHPQRYRCWIFKRYMYGHGPLAGAEAIARSCNVFFYTLGERLGAERLVKWLSAFGLGEVTGSGVTGENPGNLPDLEKLNQYLADHPQEQGDKHHEHLPGFTRPDAIFMGIGQGPVTWTPLQAATAYATIARGGKYIAPTVIKDEFRTQPRESYELNVNPEAVRIALQGLDEVVNASYGSGRQISKLREPIFNHLDDVKIYGKSGTAQGAPLRRPIDDDGDGYPDRWGDEVLRDGDHSWFVAMVQPEGADRPKYAIAVVVEYGGSGSNVAGPIANQVVHALKAEGYLQ